MRIKFKMIGSISSKFNKQEIELIIESEKTSLRIAFIELCKYSNSKYSNIKDTIDNTHLIINKQGQLISWNDVICDGECLTILPKLFGG